MQETWVQPLGREDPWRRKWQPTPLFLPGESQDIGVWLATVHRVTESDMTEVTEQARTLPSTVATIHLWLLSCFRVTKVTEELNF